MRSIRIVLAGIVGGVVMFVWGAVWAVGHTSLPIGEMGAKNLPGEETLMTAMKDQIKERGLYMFPGFDPKDRSQAAEDAYDKKVEAGPSGILVITPGPGEASVGKMLGKEFASNFAAALVAAMLLARYCGGVVCRTVAAMGIGLAGWLSINVSYWNWYGFPGDFTMGQGIEQVVGWLLSGLAIAVILPKGCGCGAGGGTGCGCGGGKGAAQQPLVGV